MSDDKLSHEKMPRPKAKVVNFDKIDTWDEASDYVSAAFHASVDQYERWQKAGQAYLGAYMGLIGLKALPGDAGLAKIKDLIADANRAADDKPGAKKENA